MTTEINEHAHNRKFLNCPHFLGQTSFDQLDLISDLHINFQKVTEWVH